MKFGGALKNIVGGIAPTLGAALGGPLGGAAAKMVAEVLGCEPRPADIEKAIQNATPEQLAEIKKAELDYAAKMKEMDVDVFELETLDIQDARKSFANDWTPRLFALLSLVAFVGYIFLITVQPMEQNSEAVINLVLGYLGGLISGISSFYFGASNSKGD